MWDVIWSIIRILPLIVLIHAVYKISVEKQKYFTSIFLYIIITIALVSILSSGIETYLFWMPDDWGGYQDGEFKLYKPTFRIAFGLVASIYLLFCIDKACDYDINKEYIKTMQGAIETLFIHENTEDIQKLTELTNGYIENHNYIFENHDRNQFSTIGKLKAYEDIISLIKKKIRKIEAKDSLDPGGAVIIEEQ